MSDNALHWNVKIDFNKKPLRNNTKPQQRNNRPWGSFRRNNENRNTEHRVTDLIDNPNREAPVKIVNLGWLEQVWENMSFFEYKDDIFTVDAGMLMPGGDMFGIDYIIPDVSYLKKNKHKIRWMIITHGHLDHIWAIKHVLPDLDFPTVYATPLAIALIKKSLEGTPLLQHFKYHVVNPDIDVIKLWVFSIEFFRVNHSIPESIGLAIHTPKGLIVHTWDFKIDFTPAVDKVADLAKIARIWQEWVKLMLSESTNALVPGRTPSEQTIGDSIENVIKNTHGRLIIATFSSLVWRIAQIIEYAVKYNKIVFLGWRSMVNNVEIWRELGYINAPAWLIRKLWKDVDSVPDERVIILTTWSQWEEFSALVRIADGEHPFLKIKENDKILLSAVPIPWNEGAVIDMINNLIRKWADVITNKELDLHVSWHAYQEDLKIMLSLVKPEHLIPIHGELFMRNHHKKLAISMWVDREKIFLMDNGNILEIYSDKVAISPKKLKLDTVMIDGLWIWHLSWEYVMKARQIMAEDGMVSLIFKIDSKSKELVGNIQIESRWFVYSSEVKKIHTNIVEYVKKRYAVHLKRSTNVKDILKVIKDELTEYLTKYVGRVPMIIPMFVYINRDGTWYGQDEEIGEDDIVGMTLEEQGNVEWVEKNEVY